MVGHSPPPFFKRGPAPLAKLVFFVIVSLAMLVSDLNLRYLDAFRQGLSVLAYPLQMAAATPADFVRNASDYFASLVRLQIENKELKARQLKGAERLLLLDQIEQENRHLRALLEARERQAVKSTVAEIIYTAKDPFSRKVILDKGAQMGIEAGQAVVDETGVIGQITRVFPMQAELTLLTDKDQAIPVMIVRNGLRAVMADGGRRGARGYRTLLVWPYAVALVAVAVSLFPIFWMLMLAMKNAEEQTTTYFSFSPTWSNFATVLSDKGTQMTIFRSLASSHFQS